jgi:hypothetical protein
LSKSEFRLNFLCYVALWLSLAMPVAAVADQALTPYSAEYKVKISVLSGILTTDLRPTDAGFEATHVIEPKGLAKIIKNGHIVETSRFTVNDEHVKASWYRSEDTLSKDKTRAEVSFEWSGNAMSGTVNDEEIQFDLDGLVHDRVAIQYQLMQDLLNGSPEEHYVLFDIDEFKTLIISNVGEREIKTPAGTFHAVGIQHQKKDSSRVTTLWCVAELGYLPALIEQHHKGKLRLRATLSNYTPLAE